MTHLSLVNVSKQIGTTQILEKVNVDIHQGEFLVVVGPSGCGKSTLMRLIAGLDELSSGDIHMNQRCVTKMPATLRDMAMVFQSYALYPHMTVFENMAYGLKLKKFSQAEINQRVYDTAKLLRITPYLSRKPSELSGGQRQRVAMGRAMSRSPSVYLFDEPLSNLDAKLRTEMRHEIRRLHQRFKTTSIYVTHDQTEAMTMADRILILNQGHVEQIGTPQELYQQPASVFVAGFTGHYPVNLIPVKYNLTSQQIESHLGIVFPYCDNLKKLNHQQELIIAIRAEHIQLTSEGAHNCIKVRVDWIDDMGADKMIQSKCVKTGLTIHFRINSETLISDEYLFIDFPKSKLSLFDKNTGLRVGDWCEKN